MKSKTVDVYSDGMAYWWRGLALLVGIGVIYGLGIVSQGLAPAPSFHVMLLAAAAIWVVIAFINRPKSFRIEDELVLRSYTAPQMDRLIDSSGCWDCIETYDFRYRIDEPIEVDSTSEDVVYVLKRKKA